jgi:hypothetical protein
VAAIRRKPGTQGQYLEACGWGTPPSGGLTFTLDRDEPTAKAGSSTGRSRCRFIQDESKKSPVQVTIKIEARRATFAPVGRGSPAARQRREPGEIASSPEQLLMGCVEIEL